MPPIASTIHPAQRAAIDALESFHRQFIVLNHALSEVGCGYLVVAKHTYENALAALNHTRWDDAEGRDRRYGRLEEESQRFLTAYAEVYRATTALTEDSELKDQERTKYLLFAARCAERELGRLMENVQAARLQRTQGR